MSGTESTLESEVLRAAGGDRDAFARLVTATRSLVASIAVAELRDADVARDVAQDVYLQVWADLHALRNPRSFLPFLRQVTRLRARRVAERRAREVGGPDADAAIAGVVEPSADAGRRLVRSEEAAALRDALDALPADARETVALYYLEGHSAAQVARLLGLGEAAVYQRLSRARAQLRADLMARLGDSLGKAAPGAAFTAAVLAALPSGASAMGAGASAVAPVASVAGGKSSVLGGVVAVLAILAAVGSFVGSGGSPGHGGGGGSSIARPVPPVTRDETAPTAAGEEQAGEGLEVRVTSGGAPLSGAEVRLYRRLLLDPDTGRPGWQVSRAGRTGPDGQIRLAARPGAWLVSARAPGLAAEQREVVHAAGATTSRVEIDLVAPVTLAGRVVARASGEPVPLATIWMERESSRGSGLADLPVEERMGATADPSGRFAMVGPAPGAYRVVVEAPGHARTNLRQVVVPRRAPLVVELGAAGVIQGVVTTADGRPAAGAEVSFAGAAELVVVTTGAGGGYAAEVPPGSYRVAAALGAATGSFPVAVSVAASGTAWADVRLGKGGAIAGRVLDTEGAPIAGALLLVSPVDAAGVVGRAISGGDGGFEVGPLAAGEYDLDASAEGHSRASPGGLVVLAGQRFELDVRLEGVGSVEGCVRGPDGAPVQGARVSGGKTWGGAPGGPIANLGAGSPRAEAVTGADGRYLLEGLDAGVTSLRARRSEGEPGVARTLEISAGRRATADFALPTTGVVEGIVRLPDGTPAGAGVSVCFSPGGPALRSLDAARVEVADGGRYRAELPAGDHVALALRRGSPPPREWTPVKVVGGETAHLDLVARSGEDDPRSLKVNAVEPGGAPAAQATVVVSAAGFRAMSMADDEGHATLPRPAGPATVTASRGGRRSAPVTLADGDRTIAVELQPAATVRGRVVASTGEAPRGFTVDVEIPGAQEGFLGEAQRRRFVGDRFEIAEFPTVPARIVVTTPDGQVGEASISLTPGESAECDVEVRAAGAIRVRPVGPDGRPVEGAYVVVGSRMIDTAMDGLFFAGGDGRTVVVKDLPTGRQSVRVGARLHREVVRDVEVPPGQEVDLGVVRLEPVSR